MNVISGFAEVLLQGCEDPQTVQESAQAIYRNAQVQIKLVTDLLDVSRGITGKLVLDPRPMDLKNLINDIIPPAREAASKKGVLLIVSSEITSGTINGDPARISQVIWNLLSNSLKFTPSGGQIEVHLSGNNQWIELKIKDSGVGIDPNFLPKVFERFLQQDSSITKNFGGLGLGLAIVRHIVELHGGQVQAHSDGIGQGATFTVLLPLLSN